MNDDAPKRHWLVVFEDEAVKPVTFSDEGCARRYYEERLQNWNCHLFMQVSFNGTEIPPMINTMKLKIPGDKNNCALWKCTNCGHAEWKMLEADDPEFCCLCFGKPWPRKNVKPCKECDGTETVNLFDQKVSESNALENWPGPCLVCNTKENNEPTKIN